MCNNIKSLLEEINKISRQILSCILSMQEETRENTASVAKVNNETDSQESANNLLTQDEMSAMISTREKLIHILFEQNTLENLAREHPLLNDMKNLDNQLSTQSKAYKKMLSEQVIKLKNSKKVKNLYQKY